MAEKTPVDSKQIGEDSDQQQVSQVSTDMSDTTNQPVRSKHEGKWYASVFEAGSATQIVIAAALAIALGLGITAAVDEVPAAASKIIAIPGTLWLRCLKAVVMPLIIVSMILAMQRLKEMHETGGNVAKWAVIYYVGTTCLAIAHSTIVVSQGWVKLMENTTSADELYEQDEDATKVDIADTVVELFNSFITDNLAASIVNNTLLAVLVASIVIGYLVRPGSSILRAVEEVEKIITKIITFLVKLAPIGVFFLILPNLFKLDIAAVGKNLGVLMGASITSMLFHLWVIYPILYFSICRKNPYSYWFKCAQAWITAWGTASSAATLPLTIKCSRERGNPDTATKFMVPLGCLINMDGTAIYFPVVVVFLAATQGIEITAVNYIIVIVLATLASIGTTPIPSSSLVLTIMIAEAIKVPITEMYAVVVAIDWFIDRFRTATNVSGDLFAVAIVTKITGVTDPVDMVAVEDPRDPMRREDSRV